MITKFSAKNYKAFDSFELDLRPITILLGSNSSGKSAIINSLLMLSQSADSADISDSPLRLNGNKTGMGETLNIIKDKDPLKKLSFSFELGSSNVVRRALSHTKATVVQNHEMIVRYMSHLMMITGTKSVQFSRAQEKLEPNIPSAGDHSKSAEFRKHYLNLIKAYRVAAPKDKRNRVFPEGFTSFTEEASIQKIKDCIDVFLGLPLSRLVPSKITYSFSYNKRKELLAVSEYSQHNRFGKKIFGFKKEGGNFQVESEIIDCAILNRSRSEIIKLLTLDSMQVAGGSSSNAGTGGYGAFPSLKGSSSPLAATLGLFLYTTSKQLLQSLAGLQINHVSPLRAFPQRYYLLDKSVHHRKLNALDGTELAEILKNNPTIKDEINILLSRFNIGIDIEKINDIIYKIVVNQNSVNLELTDVGFGISQVLPILVQAYLSPKGSLTIIEQPEIHLHPNMQAWLTDALISIALKSEKRFLIETHSDALIRRLRLRIVDESSPLSEDHVKIYHLHRDHSFKCTVVDEIELNDKGDIKWPKDFMDVEIKDTIEIQQMKYAKVNKEREKAPDELLGNAVEGEK